MITHNGFDSVLCKNVPGWNLPCDKLKHVFPEQCRCSIYKYFASGVMRFRRFLNVYASIKY